MPASDLEKYQVDLVVCIDVTASMGPIIENTKRSALEFHIRLERAANNRGKSINDLRIKVVPFRDLQFEGNEAIWESPWFDIPAQNAGFAQFVNDLSAKGGGNIPESALEALWTAMNASWRERGEKRRSIIVLLTDASAHPLGVSEFMVEQQGFATPRNLNELKMRWGCIGDEEESVFGTRNFDSRRLVLLAPDTSPWSEIGDLFERSIWLPSQAGAGLSEVEWDEIARIVVQSI